MFVLSMNKLFDIDDEDEENRNNNNNENEQNNNIDVAYTLYALLGCHLKNYIRSYLFQYSGRKIYY
jgi:hypothetical protein